MGADGVRLAGRAASRQVFFSSFVFLAWGAVLRRIEPIIIHIDLLGNVICALPEANGWITEKRDATASGCKTNLN
jgi:hypothetical protein